MTISPEYIAGFIDGEGYFGLVKKARKDCIGGYHYTPVLKITQVTKHEKVLQEICNFIGYGIFWKSKKNYWKRVGKVNCSPITSLEFRGMKRVIPIAKQLEPYLIVKKEQARLLMKLEESQIEITNKNREEIDSKRTEIYNQMRILNKRGLAETKR